MYGMTGEESYGYQQGASDDSRDTQHSSAGDPNQQASGFGGNFGDPSMYGGDGHTDPSYSQDPKGSAEEGGGGGGDQVKSPPDIKYEVTPMPFIKSDDIELIEIDPDEEEEF